MSKDTNERKELLIIGAGPGGYRAAFMAADLGLGVTMVDPEVNPGGECLYRGCIPTKALLHLVKLKQEALEAAEMGIGFKSPETDLKKVKKWKDGVVDKLTGGLGQLVKSRRIEYIQGYARFTDPHTVEVDETGGETRQMAFEHAIIATGTRPVELSGMERDGEKIIGSKTALDLEKIPEKLLIVGGGYIGLEMATIYHGLGAQVSIVEVTPDFMPGTDSDLVRTFKKTGKGLFRDIFLETSVTGIDKKGGSLRATLKGPGDKEFRKEYDQVLIAVGARPDHGSLGPENAGIQVDDKGFIATDDQQRTSQPHILAVGDVTGEPQLAHKASYEGRVAAEVIAGKSSVNDARVIPAVVYTEPEIAVCGLTEAKAREKEIPYRKVKFPWSASGRAVAMNAQNGFTKLLVDPGTERILGAGIAGKDAGDLITEVALAIEMAATVTDLALTIHPHPTLAETIMEAAEIYLGHPVHTLTKKKK